MASPGFFSGYKDSHALIIGIDEYENVSPLGYAVSDAEAISNALQKNFGFRDDKVHTLLNDEATHTAILEKFLSFTSGGTDEEDRIVIFFAGHGHTIGSRRGEVGYLVPFDGNLSKLFTLIRWDELTRNADLIKAKHILFLMDACYGGLAITRSTKPGTMRFLKDMLLRPARQVITAGKADETVADLGGPLPNHSVFTGYLLEGLGGNAADTEGLITANGLMTYVYQNVGRDDSSHQTPHFGYLDGDGDMIFSAPNFPENVDAEKDEDILVAVPSILSDDEEDINMSIIDQVKNCLSDDSRTIELHDLVAKQIREVISLTVEDYFPLQETWSDDNFVKRLSNYEDIVSDLIGIQSILAFWGTERHSEILTLPIKRLAGRLIDDSGLSVWRAFRWYPLLLLLYSGGLSAVASDHFINLRILFQTQIRVPDRSHGSKSIIRSIFDILEDYRETFKKIPGYEKRITARTEYLLKILQPRLEDNLFLGADYEYYFDTFEVLLALEHADQYKSEKYGDYWGPIGRFGWKYIRGGESSPLHRIIKQAESMGEEWPPIKAGLFNGSIDRFKKAATAYSELVSKLGWT